MCKPHDHSKNVTGSTEGRGQSTILIIITPLSTGGQGFYEILKRFQRRNEERRKAFPHMVKNVI